MQHGKWLVWVCLFAVVFPSGAFSYTAMPVAWSFHFDASSWCLAGPGGGFLSCHATCYLLSSQPRLSSSLSSGEGLMKLYCQLGDPYCKLLALELPERSVATNDSYPSRPRLCMQDGGNSCNRQMFPLTAALEQLLWKTFTHE